MVGERVGRMLERHVSVLEVCTVSVGCVGGRRTAGSHSCVAAAVLHRLDIRSWKGSRCATAATRVHVSISCLCVCERRTVAVSCLAAASSCGIPLCINPLAFAIHVWWVLRAHVVSLCCLYVNSW